VGGLLCLDCGRIWRNDISADTSRILFRYSQGKGAFGFESAMGLISCMRSFNIRGVQHENKEKKSLIIIIIG